MNFKLSEATLIVDPKGFPFGTVDLPKELPALDTSQQSVEYLAARLIDRWVLYQPADIIQLDFCLGHLFECLSNSVAQYKSALVIKDYEQVGSIEKPLKRLLQIMEETTKRAFFYEITLATKKLYGHTNSINNLYYMCDDFELLRVLSEIHLRFVQYNNNNSERLLLDDHATMNSILIKTIISKDSNIFWDPVRLFQPRPSTLEYETASGVSLDLVEELRRYSSQTPTFEIVQELGKQHKLTEEEKIALHINLRLAKICGDSKQSSMFVETSKNLYLCKEEMYPQQTAYWQQVYSACLQLKLQGIYSDIQINQRLPSSFSNPKFLKYLKSTVQKKKNKCPLSQLAELLVCANFYHKNLSECNERYELEQTIFTIIIKILPQDEFWTCAEDILEFVEATQEHNFRILREIFQPFRRFLQKVVRREVTVSQVFQFESSMMHFFKYFLSASTNLNTPFYKQLIDESFIKDIRLFLERSEKPSTSDRQLRIVHFLFNQMLFFAQSIPGFDDSLCEPTELLEDLAYIFEWFFSHNMLLFKLNFKLVQRLAKPEQTAEDSNTQAARIQKLFWNTIGKFLIYWGPRSYIQEDISELSNKYSLIVPEILELLPSLFETNLAETNLLKQVLGEAKNQYLDSQNKYIQCWMTFMAFKHNMIFKHLLYAMCFLKDTLSQTQLKYILDSAIYFASPFVTMTQSSLVIQQIDQITSNFPIEVVEAIFTYCKKEAESIKWEVCNDITGHLIWYSLWQQDRTSFIEGISKNAQLRSEHIKTLSNLRKLEVYATLFANLQLKLSEEAKNSIVPIRVSHQILFQKLQEINRVLAPKFSQEIVENLYEKQQQLKVITSDPSLTSQSYKKIAEVVKMNLVRNNSSLGFQKAQLNPSFAIVNLLKSLEGFIQSVDRNKFESVVIKQIQNPTYRYSSPQKANNQYKALAISIEAIRCLEHNCAWSSEVEKNAKKKLLLPLSVQTLNEMRNRYDSLSTLIPVVHAKETIFARITGVHVRQIRRHLINYLLTDHFNCSQTEKVSKQEFEEKSACYLGLYKSILKYIWTAMGYFEEIHNPFIESAQNILSTALTNKQNAASVVLGLLDMFLYSTFQLQTRVRSATISQLISFYASLTDSPKQFLNSTLLHYFTTLFRRFVPDYEIPQQVAQPLMLSKQISQGMVFLPQKYSVENLSLVTASCTHAMITNLISRVNFKSLSDGILHLYSSSDLRFKYLRYLVCLSTHLLNEPLIADHDLETLILDVFGNLSLLLSELRTNDTEILLDLIIQLTKNLYSIPLQLKETRQALTKLLLGCILRKPELQSFLKLRAFESSLRTFRLVTISYEAELAQNCKSHLHLLNCLYLGQLMSTRLLRSNWQMILENHDESEVQQHIHNMLLSQQMSKNKEFLQNHSVFSPQLDVLLCRFIERYRKYIDTLDHCYVHYYINFRVATTLTSKYPTLMSQLLNYAVSPKQSLLEFILNDTLKYTHLLAVELISSVIKTNSGFVLINGQLTPQNSLVFRNIIQTITTSLRNFNSSEQTYLFMINVLKTCEIAVRNCDRWYMSAYKSESLKPANPAIDIPILDNIVLVLLGLAKRVDSPVVVESITSVLNVVLTTKFRRIKVQKNVSLQNNLTYYLNTQLAAILNSQTVQFPVLGVSTPQQLAQTELPESLRTVTVYTPSLEEQSLPMNCLLNYNYHVHSHQEEEFLGKQSLKMTSKVFCLTEAGLVDKCDSYIHQTLTKDLTSIPLESHLEFHIPYSASPASVHSNQETFPLRNQELQNSQDDLSRDNEENKNEEEQAHYEMQGLIPIEGGCSSFDDLIVEDGIIQQNLEFDQAETVDTSGDQLIVSPKNVSILLENDSRYKKMDKLDILGRIERGEEVAHLLKFVTDEDLTKLSKTVDGKLLLDIAREKAARGYQYAANQFEDRFSLTQLVDEESEALTRYLNELYPGCIYSQTVSEMWKKQDKFPVPKLDEEVCAKILHSWLECQEETTKSQLSGCIDKLCLNNSNLVFFANCFYFILSLSSQEAQLLNESGKFPHIKNLNRIKTSCGQIISVLFEKKIGLPIWLFAKFDPILLQVENLPCVQQFTELAKILKKGQKIQNSNAKKLIELIVQNTADKTFDGDFQEIVISLKSYIQKIQKQTVLRYPLYILQEGNWEDSEIIEKLAEVILKQQRRLKNSYAYSNLLKVLLQLYPATYEPFMYSILRTVGEQLKVNVEMWTKDFKRFELNNRNLIMDDKISKNEKVERLVDLLLVQTKKYEESNTRIDYLKSLMADISLDLVPWFKDWRFQAENREEIAAFHSTRKLIKKELESARNNRNFLQHQKLTHEIRRHAAEFSVWKAKFKTEFTMEYIKPIHELASVSLLKAFQSSIALIQSYRQVFPCANAEETEIMLPVYKQQSIFWKCMLAYFNIFSEEECSTYHSMAQLSTRENIISKTELQGFLSSNGEKRRSSRKKLSIVSSSTIDLQKLVKKLSPHTDLMNNYLKDGSKLMRALVNLGNTEFKFKYLRRKRPNRPVKEIEVDRNTLWFDTMNNIDEDFINNQVKIRFKGEIGIDYGGLTREWLTLVTKQLFDPHYGLFELSANKRTIQPNKYSYLIPHHLLHFKKLGTLVGKCITEGWNIEINFTKSFLKHLLGSTLYVNDLQDIDPETARSLMWILQNQVDESLQITFTYEEELLGERKTIELIENGKNIYVNDFNKKEYVKSLCKAKMTDSIRQQSKAFMEGLESVVPYDLLRCLTYKELGLYLAGMPKIDLVEMQTFCRYNNYEKDNLTVKMFWQVLAKFNQEQMANFLFFLSGSFKVPYGGFKEYPIILNKCMDVKYLPVAHTCFNTIDLPDYRNLESLEEKLRKAISEGKGFNVS